MKTLIIGNSHTHALELAASGIKDARFKVFRLGNKAAVDVASAAIAMLGEDDTLVMSFGGVMHNHVSLLRHREPFDVLAGDEEANDLPIVTQSMLRHAFAHPTWCQRGKIEGFKAKTGARVVHLATPPPMADHEFIMQQRIYYRGVSFAEHGLNPASFRLKIWEIEMQTLAKVCEECGVGFLYPPEQARTAEGYLARDCYADDAAHANARYGRLVLEQLDADVRSAVPREMALA